MTAEQSAVALVWLPVLAALALVAAPRAWRALRPVVTIAHEGGHAAVALLAGRRLAGVRLHTDASGATSSRGRARGVGMIMTLLAGYMTPCLLGLAAAALVAAGQHVAVLVAAVVLLGALLIATRNVFGIFAIVATTGVLVALLRWAGPQWQQAGASLLAWFLLFGGVRSVADLRQGRRHRLQRDSDPDQLARITYVPAIVWLLVFAATAIGSVAAAVVVLLPW